VLVGTICEASHVPLSKWLLAFYLLIASKNGVAAFEIHRTLSVTQQTAWFMMHRMMHRIREAMKLSPAAPLLANTTIAADETYIGGAEKNTHADKRDPKVAGRHHPTTPVFTLIDAQTGEARSQIVPNVNGDTRFVYSRGQVGGRRLMYRSAATS